MRAVQILSERPAPVAPWHVPKGVIFSMAIDSRRGNDGIFALLVAFIAVLPQAATGAEI